METELDAAKEPTAADIKLALRLQGNSAQRGRSPSERGREGIKPRCPCSVQGMA
jgi:hypothetical protein